MLSKIDLEKQPENGPLSCYGLSYQNGDTVAGARKNKKWEVKGWLIKF